MTYGLITADPQGNIWMDDLTRQWFGQYDNEPVIPMDDWASAFHCYDPVTRMPLSKHRLPAIVAMELGEVVEADVLAAPPDCPERIIHAIARPLIGADGSLLGVAVVTMDVTEGWLERVGAQEVEYTISVCPCDAWQVTAPVGTPLPWIQEAVLEHMGECVVLAATRMASMASV